MSYQVLARKWRPATFKEMVGQEHVLKALVNALDSGRLHHAYLFTGTRGVGKTSIARLFAKALNCEVGVSAEPCGQCSACLAIAEGRFVDLIEVDAASRTKVEDTRELLENVQYAPTQGRYKVYLIDEVHMLSSHSFNALLKTLEEPPPHIKFLLATTDPQKLPVTILSRCLQFNLKNMSPERVVEHLNHVLDVEKVPFDESALWLLGRAANGSMRDALSLADQAISYGDGEIKDADVRAMLGSVDHQQILQLLNAVAANNAAQVMQTIAQMAEYGVDCDDVLAEMVSLLHRVAIGQMLPNSVDNSLGDQAEIVALAQSMKAEDVQLFYQIALNGRKDLPIVPVPREGLEMTMLRMLAFRPVLPGEHAYPNVDANQLMESVEAKLTPVVEPVASEPSIAESVKKGAEGVAGAGAESAFNETAAVNNRELDENYQSYAPTEMSTSHAKPVEDEQPPWATETLPPDDPGKKPETPEEEAKASGVKVETPELLAPVSPSSSEFDIAAPEENSREQLADSLHEEPLTEEVSEVPERASIEEAEPASALAPEAISEIETISFNELDALQWINVIDAIGISGMTYNIAANMSVLGTASGQVNFVIAAEQQHLMNDVHRERIETSLSAYFDETISIDVQAGVATEETPGQFQQRRQQERLAAAHLAIENDENVQQLIARFDARIDKQSVKPL